MQCSVKIAGSAEDSLVSKVLLRLVDCAGICGSTCKLLSAKDAIRRQDQMMLGLGED